MAQLRGAFMAKLARVGLRKPLVALVLLTVAAAGRGTGKSTLTTPSSGAGGTPTVSLFSKLPAAIQASKEIKVGSDVAYATIEFFKEGTQEVEGVDYDLAQAIGARLGVKVTFVNTPSMGSPQPSRPSGST